MQHDLKRELLDNKFVYKLRMELLVDECEYQKLTSSLRKLASEWKSHAKVDKELVQELYVLAPITRNMAPEIFEQASEVEEMATELDALVMDCLST